MKSVTWFLFIATQLAALGWVTISYAIAVYAPVRLEQPFPVVELSQQAITTILGVNVLKVVENIFEHNDSPVSGIRKKVRVHMNSIDWRRKISSRKLWAAVAGIVTGLAMVFGLDENTISTVAGAVVSIASVVTYIITEGKVDAESVKSAVESVQDAVEDVGNG